MACPALQPFHSYPRRIADCAPWTYRLRASSSSARCAWLFASIPARCSRPRFAMTHHRAGLPPSGFAPAEVLVPVYLHVQSRRAGNIKGEAKAAGHVDEIEVTSWQWGAQASAAMHGTALMSRSQCAYRALTICKRLDTATTALMWALVRNDELREVRLTMRRPASSDGAQEDVFTVTLSHARVVALDHEAAADGSTREVVTIESKVVQTQYQSGKPRKLVVAHRLPAPQSAQKAIAPALGMGAPGGQVASDADIDRGVGRAALWAAGKIDQFQRTELGRNLQALPPEGAAAGGLKAGLLLAGRLAKAGDAAKGTSWGLSISQTKAALSSSQEAYKGSTVVGHALSKHAGRNPETWGTMTGSMKGWNEQGMAQLRDVIRGPGQFTKQTYDNGLTFLEKRLPDGRGVRLNMDGSFKGFLD